MTHLPTLLSLPGLLIAAAIVLGGNPWFLDRYLVYALLGLLLPALAGWALLKALGRTAKLQGLAITLGCYALLLLKPAPALTPPKVMVMGVDGATFSIIDPRIESGELPHFGDLTQRGTRAILRSMEPMFSPLLWTTMASGKPPEEHGIHGFHVHATDCQVPRFWDIADAEGQSVGIYKWLVTYPPRAVDGFIVPSWLAPGPETFPAELSFVKELELSNRLKRRNIAQVRSNRTLVLEGIGRGLRFGTLLEAAWWSLRERVERPDEDQRHLTLQLLRGKIDRDVFIWSLHHYQPELATFSYYATDGLAHRFWRAFEPQHFPDVTPEEVDAYGDAIPAAYRQADQILGEVMALLGPESHLVLVSDHGFQALRPGEGKAFFAPLTARLQERISAEVGPVDISRMGAKLNVGLVDDALEPAAAREYIESLLAADGSPFFRVDEVPGNERALGLTLTDEDLTEEKIAAGTVGGEPLADYVKLTESFSGEHRDDGVLYMMGPLAPAGALWEDAHMLDVAPTIQALMGVSPAEDLTGRVLLGEASGGPASRDPLVNALDWGEAGSEGVDQDALRALGYVE